MFMSSIQAQPACRQLGFTPSAIHAKRVRPAARTACSADGCVQLKNRTQPVASDASTVAVPALGSVSH